MNIEMKYSHAPEGYVCPICAGLQKVESDDTLIRPSDFVYEDELVSGFINSFFMGKNAGHVAVVPNDHFENIFDLPDEVGAHMAAVAKKMAVALKRAYKCDGITTRSNSEPAGDQHAFHYHLHVFPRYDDDGFNEVQPSEKRLALPDERVKYAEKLRAVLNLL